MRMLCEHCACGEGLSSGEHVFLVHCSVFSLTLESTLSLTWRCLLPAWKLELL